jgi:hypothetical protein
VKVSDSVQIFEWIAGKTHELPNTLQHAVPEFAQHHRLMGLALGQARGVAGFAEDAMSQLAAEHRKALQRRATLHTLASEVLSAAREADARALIVKGMTAAALTGNPALYRWSGDVDFICEDGEVLAAALRARGFRSTKPSDEHEIVLSGPLGTTELHRFWPLRHAPSDLRSLTEVRLPLTDRIPFGRLAAGSRHGITEETADLMFPSVEIAALTCMTTSLRDIIWEPFSNASRRLCHFMDAYQLLTNAEVDWAVFDAAAADLQAMDSVGTAYAMFERFFPDNPLQRSRCRPERQSGLLIQFVNGPSGLWHREDLVSVFFSSFRERLLRLGATPLEVNQVKQHRSRAETEFDGVYEAGDCAELPSRQLSLVRDGGELLLSIRVEKAAERGDSVIVESGDEYCHWYHAGQVWGHYASRIEYGPESFTLEVKLPEALLGKPVMLGMECLTRGRKVVTAR